MNSPFHRAGLAALALLWAVPATAHEAIVQHGGRLAEAGAFHVELVARGEAVDVYVTDARGRPVPVAGFKGAAILVVSGKPVRVPLAAAGGNRLSGASETDLGASPRGAVQITTAAGATASGSFK